MRTPVLERRTRTTLLALVAALLLGGCASIAGEPEPAYATLVVENDNTSTVNVYALRSGSRFRLGTVTGLGTEEFPLRRHMLGTAGDLQLLIDPIGSRRNYPSQRIVVSEGDVIELRVSSFLR